MDDEPECAGQRDIVWQHRDESIVLLTYEARQDAQASTGDGKRRLRVNTRAADIGGGPRPDLGDVVERW